MNPGMKMMLITNARKGESDRPEGRSGRYGGQMEYGESNYDRMGYDGAESNYDMEDRYRGRRGMESRMNVDDPESRRRRDGRGRFRSEWEDGMESGRVTSNYGNESRMEVYPNRPFPVYEGGGYMNPIGFDPHREIETNYHMNATHHTGNEMEYKSNPKMGGGYSSGMSMPMTKEMAEEWTKNMKNEDGTKGPHWTMDQVKQVMAQKGIKYEPAEFYAILNAMYSDYCAVLKKHGVNNVDFYVDLTSAWLNDSDAMPNKASLYYEYIVKK